MTAAQAKKIADLEAELAARNRTVYIRHQGPCDGCCVSAEAEVERLRGMLSCIPCADRRHLQCTGSECNCPECYGENAAELGIFEGGERESEQGRPVPKPEGQTSGAGASAAAFWEIREERDMGDWDLYYEQGPPRKAAARKEG